ncbi:MAG: hypothetical protein JXQ91_07745 [Vannielia sp.]|uniref:hypothetical protein n=1 Tax=Vannielia sp. TaxID=2813045 RepID=UPI003B8E7671
MEIDWSELLAALGGGPSAVALIFLGWLYWRAISRNDDLTDKIIDISVNQANAMNELARSIEKVGGK